MNVNKPQDHPFLVPFKEKFLTEFERLVTPLLPPGSVFPRSAIDNRTDELIRENRNRMIDGPSENYIAYASFILACYRELLSAGLKESQCLKTIGRIMADIRKANVKTHLKDRFGLTLSVAEDAFETVSENFKLIGERMYGKSFIYEQDFQNGERNFVNIRKCFFHDFLAANHAPELNWLFCALDNIWAEELEKSCGIYFRRPTMLSRGEDMCRFQFFRNRPSD